jgi:hypothetical protein
MFHFPSQSHYPAGLLTIRNGAMRRAAGETTPATAVASKPRGQQAAGGRISNLFFVFQKETKINNQSNVLDSST